jgi:hypothetical protein
MMNRGTSTNQFLTGAQKLPPSVLVLNDPPTDFLGVLQYPSEKQTPASRETNRKYERDPSQTKYLRPSLPPIFCSLSFCMEDSNFKTDPGK